MNTEIPFNVQLRKATREIHSISDALVNAKLVFALSNDSVWAEGLLIFYDVFRFLEDAMDRHKDDNLGRMFVEGMDRAKAFEEDLSYYMGKDWRFSYVIRESVAKYLYHLMALEQEDPDMLIAYVYHLYMGLLSGGQIIMKKRLLTNKFKLFTSKNKRGYAVTDFGDKSIPKLKKEIIERVNAIADTLNEKSKRGLIIESQKVFEFNNEIISTIKGTSSVLFKKILISLTAAALVTFIVMYKIK